MPLIRNYKSEEDKKAKQRIALESIALQIQNAQKLRRPEQQDINLVPLLPPEPPLLLSDEAELKVQTKQEREKLALKNLLTLTDEANAKRIIDIINQKNIGYMKYFNTVFPFLEREIKKKYKNVSVPFFVNYALDEIKKVYDLDSEREEIKPDVEEEIKNAEDKQEKKEGLELKPEEEQRIIDNPNQEEEERKDDSVADYEPLTKKQKKKIMKAGDEFIAELIDTEFKENPDEPAINKIISNIQKSLKTWVGSLADVNKKDKAEILSSLSNSDYLEELIDKYENPNKAQQPVIKPIKPKSDSIKIAFRQLSGWDTNAKTDFKKENIVKDATGVVLFFESEDPLSADEYEEVLNFQLKPIFMLFVKQVKNLWYVYDKTNGEWISLTKENLIALSPDKIRKHLQTIDINTFIQKLLQHKLDKKLLNKKPIIGFGYLSAPQKYKIKYGLGFDTIQKVRPYRNCNKYVAFGKYRLCISKLDDDNILSITYEGGHPLNFLRSTKISDNFKSIIHDILDNKFNDKLIKLLSEEEALLLQKVVKYSMVLPDQVQLYKDYDKKDVEDFFRLKGIIGSGNDNPELKIQLKKLLKKFLENNKISKREYEEIMKIL